MKKKLLYSAVFMFLVVCFILNKKTFAETKPTSAEAKSSSSDTKSITQGKSTSSLLNGLGSQSSLIDKANPETRDNVQRVIQKRAVDREMRSEITLNSGWWNGGDVYYKTQGLGVQYDLHLNPFWSLGVRYIHFFNELNSEGKKIFEHAERFASSNDPDYKIPDMDPPYWSVLGTVNFYPIYGKMSLFESTVSYFDLYVMGGAGTLQLKKGPTPVYTAGGGMGIWWDTRWSSRMELRYQGYEDEVYTGRRQVNNTVFTVGVGILL